MSDDKVSLLKKMIELEELKLFNQLNGKKEEKKEEKKKPWWDANPIKLWLILVLTYPVVGKAYVMLLTALWK